MIPPRAGGDGRPLSDPDRRSILMPTYVYECRECRHRLEIFQKFKAEPLRTCPECREASLRKVLFPAGVVFKGSGFYVTDSRAARSKASAAANGAKEGKKPKGGKPGARAEGGKTPAAAGSSSGGKEAAESGAKKDS